MAVGSSRSTDDESLSIFMLPEGGPEAPAAPLPTGSRRASVFRSVRRHWLVALAAFVLTALAAVPLVIHLRTPVYSAEATILVSQTFARNLNSDQELQLPRFNEFIKQQMVTISREEVALDAFDRLGDRRSLWIDPSEPRRDAAARLTTALIVRQVPDTAYVTVALEGHSPEGLAEIVNAVVDAYLSRARGQPFPEMDIRLEALNRHKAELVNEIRTKTELLSRWAREIGVASFDSRSSSPDSPGSPAQEAEHALQAARAKRLDGEARLSAVESRYELLAKGDIAAEARELLATDTEFVGLKLALITRKNEQKAKLTGLTAEHEGRKTSEKMIAELDAELESSEKSAIDRLKKLLLLRREARMIEEKQTIAADLEVARKVEAVLEADAAQLAKKTQRFNDVLFEAQSVLQESERLRRQLSAIEDRIDMMRLESFAPGFVHLAAAAKTPTSPAPPKIGKALAVLGTLGLGLVLGVPLLIDTLDTRIRVPGDLVREVDAGVLMGVPERHPETEPFIRDQFRRMALGIDRERRHKNMRRIVFTGVKSNAGTTQMVLELTRELRHLGVHAVALEANALHPDPRFGGSNGQPGLINVLGGRTSLEQTVRPPDKGLPLRIPLGDTGGRNILTGANSLPRVFSEIMGQLEIVLVDAPPVLLSSDAEMLVGMGDAVVLIVGSYTTTVADVRRAFRILRQVGTPVLQTVVNRVRVREGGRGRDYAELIKEYNVVARSPTA